MLVGNKSDLSTQRKTSRELGEEFAKEEELLFIEASAKSGEGVEELFMEIGTSFFLSFFLPFFFFFIPSFEGISSRFALSRLFSLQIRYFEMSFRIGIGSCHYGRFMVRGTLVDGRGIRSRTCTNTDNSPEITSRTTQTSRDIKYW